MSYTPPLSSVVGSARTANGALSHAGSGSARVDLFFSGFVRGCPEDNICSLMRASWRENPSHTVQLLFHCRDPRSGKGEKAAALAAALWLRKHKPLTYLLNLAGLIEVAYYKDLLQLASEAERRGLPRLGDELIELELFAEILREDKEKYEQYKKLVQEQAAGVEKASKQALATAAEGECADSFLLVGEEADEAFVIVDAGEEKKADHGDADAPAPVKRARLGPVRPSLTLSAKWAPTENHAFDKKNKFAARIAKLIFNQQTMAADQTEGAEKAKPSKILSLKLYRHLLSSLRGELGVVERLMCAGQWSSINFSRVPARAHHLLKKAFLRHQTERYNEYQQALKTKKTGVKINTSGLLPHEIVGALYAEDAASTEEILEAQWSTIRDNLAKAGTFDRSLAVVDVSGSMGSPNGKQFTPIKAALALGLLMSQLTQPPFKGHVLTFHAKPQFHAIDGTTLRDQVASLAKADWGMNTNLEAVFRLILARATQFKVPAEAMAKQLIIFSDMQFDAAVGSGVTNFEAIDRLYRQAGYERPGLVFWNLNGANCRDCPVTVNSQGVALMSGYSGELLKAFMSQEMDQLTPISIMEKAIEKYQVTIEESEIETL